jgi:hypothetical protein
LFGGDFNRFGFFGRDVLFGFRWTHREVL